MVEIQEDRRATPREAAIANRVHVEWWVGDRMQRTQGRMLNISDGGALVVADVLPPLGQSVWLRVESPAPTDEISARVVRVGARNEMGLSFARSCPYELYLTATLGINPCSMLVGR